MLCYVICTVLNAHNVHQTGHVYSIGMIVLHVLEGIAIPSMHLPDLFPVLWSIVGCAMFVWCWLYCVCCLLGDRYVSIYGCGKDEKEKQM